MGLKLSTITNNIDNIDNNVNLVDAIDIINIINLNDDYSDKIRANISKKAFYKLKNGILELAEIFRQGKEFIPERDYYKLEIIAHKIVNGFTHL